MLSTGAFNALLKTLEEPPEHVKFILATTEPQKLPATILSRCQRFDFKKISNEDIAKRLKYVAKESNIEITEDAIRLISVLAEGAMRDALSILERCIQDGNNEIKIDLVKDLVGMPKLEFISKITSAIFDYNLEQALENLNIVLEQGKDVTNLIWELIKYIKDILVYKTSKKLDLYSNEEIKEIDELAEKISKERLLKIIYDLSECENNIKWSSQKSLMLQVEIIKLCSKENNITSNAGLEDINNKINMLEEKINDIATKIYGADGVDFTKEAEKEIANLEKLGYGNLPICMAKTQYSLSDDPSKLGRPSNFRITVRKINISAGAGFIVALTGDIMKMPGLPKVPAAQRIDIDENGVISGLF